MNQQVGLYCREQNGWTLLKDMLMNLVSASVQFFNIEMLGGKIEQKNSISCSTTLVVLAAVLNTKLS